MGTGTGVKDDSDSGSGCGGDGGGAAISTLSTLPGGLNIARSSSVTAISPGALVGGSTLNSRVKARPWAKAETRVPVPRQVRQTAG
jgi:hypothetical protein